MALESQGKPQERCLPTGTYVPAPSVPCPCRLLLRSFRFLQLGDFLSDEALSHLSSKHHWEGQLYPLLTCAATKSVKHVDKIVQLEALCGTDSIQRSLTYLKLDEFLSEAVITPRHMRRLSKPFSTHKKTQQSRVQQLSRIDGLT